MTQPPPPNQPPYQPSGQPPQGGFGAPTPPPPQGQPGYGYPQGPPPAQPGYGYPNQPMQPQPQPQYMPTPQPGGSGGGKKLSTQMQIIIAAALAVVLIIGGGIWYASGKDDGGGKSNEGKNSSAGSSEGSSGGGDGGGKAPDGPGKEKAPANVNSKVAFQLPEPARDDLTMVVGSWVTDKAFVKPGVNSIVGYDVAKGSPLWTTPLPGQICAASRHVTQDNKTAIVFEAVKRTAPKFYEPCTEVGVIDLTTGKLLWSKSVTGDSSGDEKARFDQVTLSGNTVAAGYGGGSAAFDLTTGAVRWKPTVDGNECRDIGYGGGEALVAVRRCGSYGNETVTIQPVNPDNGTPLSSFKMPAGVEDARVVSTKPLVVAADVGDTGTFGISDIFSIDAKTGQLRAKIAAPGDKYEARCSASDGVEGCEFVVVGNDRIYLPTAEHEGTTDRTNEIVSFDLATGKGTSDRGDAGGGYKAYPLRMDGGNLIVYKWPPYDKGGQVVSIDGATFKQTVLMENPSDKSVREAETSNSIIGAEYRYAAGRLFISQDLMSKPSSSSSTFGKKYLAVAFSTAD